MEWKTVLTLLGIVFTVLYFKTDICCAGIKEKVLFFIGVVLFWTAFFYLFPLSLIGLVVVVVFILREIGKDRYKYYFEFVKDEYGRIVLEKNEGDKKGTTGMLNWLTGVLSRKSGGNTVRWIVKTRYKFYPFLTETKVIRVEKVENGDESVKVRIIDAELSKEVARWTG